MPSEGSFPISDVLKTELFGHFVRASEVQSAAPENPAYSQNCSFYDAETHHAFVEVFGAGGTVYAVRPQKGGDEFLVAFYRNQE